jgi:protein TonB
VPGFSDFGGLAGYEFQVSHWFPQNGTFGCVALMRRAAEITAGPVVLIARLVRRCFNPIEKTKLSASSAEFNTMKAVRKLVVLLSMGALSVVAASASALEQAYLESCRKDPGVPVPVAVVSPTVGPEFGGGSVHLEFVVGVDGKPAEFSIKSATDDVLATEVIKAVKQWRFLPAELDGKPVATKVALPVKVVEPTAGDRYAAVE